MRFSMQKQFLMSKLRFFKPGLLPQALFFPPINEFFNVKTVFNVKTAFFYTGPNAAGAFFFSPINAFFNVKTVFNVKTAFF